MRDARVHLHWGDGVVAEEVRHPTPHHVAVIQLIDMDDGSELLRFCWYDHQGRFHRSPLILDPETWHEVLLAAERSTPRLYERLTGAGLSSRDRR